MPDLFSKELADKIKSVPLNKAWAETLNNLLKEKRKIEK